MVSLDDTSVTEWRQIKGNKLEYIALVVSLDDTSVTEWRIIVHGNAGLSGSFTR